MKPFKSYIAEGRPSQRHPLEGHEYHKKTDDELKHIAKDAHEAAEAMKGHNEKAENKYRDQANDSATVRYWRKKNGMPDWYKKKYGHMKEEFVTEAQASKTGIVETEVYGTKAYHAKCMEPGCKFESKRYDRIKQAQDAAQKHAKEHFGKNVKEDIELDERCWPGYKETPGKKAYEKGSCTKEEVEQIDEMDKSQPSSSRGAEGLPLGKKAVPVKTDKVKSDALKVLQKQYKKVKEEVEQVDEVAAWQRKEGKSESGGLNRKGIESYRRENPGSKLSMAVTTKPSKLDPDSKAAKRRKSFCARMGGMKKRLTSAETARDPDSRINKALRKWNC